MSGQSRKHGEEPLGESRDFVARHLGELAELDREPDDWTMVKDVTSLGPKLAPRCCARNLRTQHAVTMITKCQNGFENSALPPRLDTG